MSSRREAFEHHQPTAAQVRQIQDVRDGCEKLADVIENRVLDSPLRTLALRHLEEVSMWANKAIVFEGKDSLVHTPRPQGAPTAEPPSMFIDNHPARQPFVYDKVDVIPVDPE